MTAVFVARALLVAIGLGLLTLVYIVGAIVVAIDNGECPRNDRGYCEAGFHP